MRFQSLSNPGIGLSSSLSVIALISKTENTTKKIIIMRSCYSLDTPRKLQFLKKKTKQTAKVKNTQNYTNERKTPKGLGCLLSSALFNVISSTSLNPNVGFQKRLEMLTNIQSTLKHCSWQMEYLVFHTLNSLGFFLCCNELILIVY